MHPFSITLFATTGDPEGIRHVDKSNWSGCGVVFTKDSSKALKQEPGISQKVGASEAEPFWTEFLRSLNRRGLRGVKLVISDSHECIKAAAAKVMKATWQRCRVHFMRNALAHAGKTQRRMVSAAIGTVFVQDSADNARDQWRSVAPGRPGHPRPDSCHAVAVAGPGAHRAGPRRSAARPAGR